MELIFIRVSGDLAADFRGLIANVSTSMGKTAEWTAKAMQDQGRANIARSGRFTGEWIDGLKAVVGNSGRDFTVTVSHSLGPMVRPHEYGATIFGKPLLWIPFDFAFEAKNINAREFPQKLVWVNRRSGRAPILVSVDDKQPKYFGKASVRIPARWHIRDACRGIANLMPGKFYEFMGS